MSRENVELIRGLMPPPDTDIASLLRDETLFARTSSALEAVIDPQVESVAEWRGGATYAGIEGFREMWLDWLQPWATYYVSVEEIIDAGDRVAVLIRDRGRRDDTEAEVELLAGSVWEIQDGKIVRVQFCSSRDETLKAAGLNG